MILTDMLSILLSCRYRHLRLENGAGLPLRDFIKWMFLGFITKLTLNFCQTITFKENTFEPRVFIQVLNLSEPLQIIR
jgi:hypothetical protein